MLCVLVIDDEAKSREPVTTFLSSRGIKYDIAESPLQAHQNMMTTDYALVFLDLDLGAGYQEGIGILAWMDQNSKQFPTVIVSSSASQPAAIRAQAEYEFVKLRFEQNQVLGLADVLDGIMSQSRSFSPQNLITRCIVAVFGLCLAGAGAYAVLWLKRSFQNNDNTSDMAVALVVFAIACALIMVFGNSIVTPAIELCKRIASSSGSDDQMSNKEDALE